MPLGNEADSVGESVPVPCFRPGVSRAFGSEDQARLVGDRVFSARVGCLFLLHIYTPGYVEVQGVSERLFNFCFGARLGVNSERRSIRGFQNLARAGTRTGINGNCFVTLSRAEFASGQNDDEATFEDAPGALTNKRQNRMSAGTQLH